MKALDRASSNKSAPESINATISSNNITNINPGNTPRTDLHSNHCSHCQADTKSRRRDFSEQTWTVLMVWGEIDTKTVDQPICEPCYNELREVLIDRTDEIETSLADHATGIKPAAIKAGNAKPVAGKIKKSDSLAG